LRTPFTDERAERMRLRRELRTAQMENEILGGRPHTPPRRRCRAQNDLHLHRPACTDLAVSACCRVTRVSTSGFYAWRANPVRNKDLDDAYLSDTIVDIWTMSRRSYGSPRVHAELKLGLDVRCSRKRVERLMRQAGICGIHRRRRGGCTKRDPSLEPSDDLVKRAFDPTEPDRLWVMDVTEHRNPAATLCRSV
jgi:HTH-like domain